MTTGASKSYVPRTVWLTALMLGGILMSTAWLTLARAQDNTRSGTSRVRIAPGVVEVVQVESDSVLVRGEAGFDTGNPPGSVRVLGPWMHIEADASDVVRVFDDAYVGPNEHIQGEVVAVFGSATIEGRVNGDVVAVFGSVRLSPGAIVEGDVVAVGGAVHHPPGATINGESVSVSFLPMAWGFPTTPTLLLGVLIIWGVCFLMGLLLMLLFPDRMIRIATTATRRTGVSLVIGILSGPLMFFSLVLLLITIIGIPIALILPIFYALAVWAGQLAVTYVLGSRMLRRRLGEGPPWGPLLAGTGLVALFFVLATVLSAPSGPVRTLAMFFGLAGCLVVTGLSMIGTGALAVSKLGATPLDLEEAPGGSAATQGMSGTVPTSPAPQSPTS